MTHTFGALASPDAVIAPGAVASPGAPAYICAQYFAVSLNESRDVK